MRQVQLYLNSRFLPKSKYLLCDILLYWPLEIDFDRFESSYFTPFKGIHSAHNHVKEVIVCQTRWIVRFQRF